MLAGDTSTITAHAETISTVSSSSTAVSLAGTIALNAIGWTHAEWLVERDRRYHRRIVSRNVRVDGQRAVEFHRKCRHRPTGQDPTDVIASITNSTITSGGALLLKALADGTIASTVTNVSSATATAATNSTNNQTAVAVGGLIATNRVSRAANAFITNSSTSTAITDSAGGRRHRRRGKQRVDHLELDAGDVGGRDRRRRQDHLRLDPRRRVTRKTRWAQNPSSFSNTQNLTKGDEVTLDANYDTPTYTIGSSNSPDGTALVTGDVIADTNGNLYRYVGSGGTFDLQTDPGLRIRHRRLHADRRRQRRDLRLHRQRFSKAWALIWRIPITPHGPWTLAAPTQTVNFGDTVLFQANYNTSNLFGITTPKTVTISAGQTVADLFELHRQQRNGRSDIRIYRSNGFGRSGASYIQQYCCG